MAMTQERGTNMDYSIDYENDSQRQWEEAQESAQNHLESLLADLITGIPKLSDVTPYPNTTSDWYLETYLRRIETVKEIAGYISQGDMMGYAERFIGDLSDNGDY